ncbi:SagB/ThcOx family dehydrogenase [Halopiger goleimassiliensis]|uniref:SagB/ThcOx family dehydrogenase n=1 Tax=Halopiger goleimassiliensis TaxID=1293048 RepID=UPI0006780540|nr:SagB/ThcOx family dehydrogenase [Halopiger goleimassiliensis]
MVDAREYHERTKHSPESLRRDAFSLDWSNKPRPFKAYRDRPRRPLERIRPPWTPTLSLVAESHADPLAGTAQSTRPAIDRDLVATLCYEAAGIVQRVETDDGRELPFRAASCTGNLHHVDLYLACDDLPGLEAGLYHFDPREFALEVLREGDVRGVVADAVGGRSGTDDWGGVAEVPVTVIATSTWWRNAWKYRDRTYRHAFWDSGTILANLLAAAHGLDQPAEVVAGFADDQVADLLGIDPEEEAPLALVPIGTGDQVPDAPAVEPIDPATEPLSDDPVDYPLIHEAWRASRLPDGAVAREWRGSARDVRSVGTVDSGDGDRVPLEPVDHETASARPLHPTVVRRGSCREFADEGPSRRQLGTVLDRATRGVPGDWNAGRADGLAFLDAYVLTTGVHGVPDGTYQYHPEGDTLERLGDVDRGTKTRLALNQKWAGDAHVNVYLLADVDAIVDRLGNRGYRLAQLEAGIVLGRLYLSTYAHRNLGGTGLTFFDDHVTDHLSPRADGQTPMTLFAFGRRAA